MIRRLSKHLRWALAIAIGFVLQGGMAVAADSKTGTGALPGVTSDYRIAKPAPQPEDALPAGENGTFKIGNTDVRISGTITVDVGVGSIKPPRRWLLLPVTIRGEGAGRRMRGGAKVRR